jgi:putative redox protein
MSMDVVHILGRGHHSLQALSCHLAGERHPDDPHRLTRVTLHLVIAGDIPGAAVERAIQLSRDKYCSVWHSMRQDIEFATSFEVRAAA